MPDCYGYWFDLFKQINPYIWAGLGTAIAIGISVLGAAWCVDGHKERGRTEGEGEGEGVGLE